MLWWCTLKINLLCRRSLSKAIEIVRLILRLMIWISSLSTIIFEILVDFLLILIFVILFWIVVWALSVLLNETNHLVNVNCDQSWIIDRICFYNCDRSSWLFFYMLSLICASYFSRRINMKKFLRMKEVDFVNNMNKISKLLILY